MGRARKGKGLGSGPTEKSRALALAREVSARRGFVAGDCKLSFRAQADEGWYICDGSEKSRTEDATLFAAIGTTHGAGDGSTTFNLPNPAARALVGAGAAPGLVTRLLGALFGQENVALTTAQVPSHNHAISQSNPHSHTIYGNITSNTTATGSFNRVSNLLDPPGGGGTNALTSSAGEHDHGGTTGSRGSGETHTNVQPSIAINLMIKR